MKIGDKMTIGGVFERIPNADRRWWQWWKPRMVDGLVLQQFTVTHISLPNK